MYANKPCYMDLLPSRITFADFVIDVSVNKYCSTQLSVSGIWNAIWLHNDINVVGSVMYVVRTHVAPAIGVCVAQHDPE